MVYGDGGESRKSDQKEWRRSRNMQVKVFAGKIPARPRLFTIQFLFEP